MRFYWGTADQYWGTCPSKKGLATPMGRGSRGRRLSGVQVDSEQVGLERKEAKLRWFRWTLNRWVLRGRRLSGVQVDSEQVGLERKEAKQSPGEL